MMQTLDYSSLVRKITLDNGMTVLMFRDTSQSKVLLHVAYAVGSAVEEEGERGLAHLLEHMIFKGTHTLNEGDIDAIARKYGATYNAFTSKDTTGYFFEVNKDNWRPFMSILADCMQNARFDREHLASEIRTVIQELRMRNDNYWLFMLEKAEEIVFPSYHPYHHAIIGYKDDLAAISAERLQAFYNKYYHPNKATLFVVGNFNEDEIINEATKAFGSIPQGPDSGHFPTHLFKVLGFSRRHFYQPLESEQLGMFWSIPGRKEHDAVVLEIITSLLGGGRSSRLYRSLVDTHKVAANVSVTANQLTHGGLLNVLVQPLPGKVKECVELVNQEITQIIEKGITDHDKALASLNKLREFITTMQSPISLCFEWLKSYFATGGEYDLFNKLKRYEAITADQIRSFIKEHLDSCFSHTMIVAPLTADKQSDWLAVKQEEEEFEQSLLTNHQRVKPLEETKYATTMPEPKRFSLHFPKPDRSFTLPNGLKIVLKQQGQWPLIALNLSFRNADYLNASLEGVAFDLMMKLLIEQTEGYARGEIATTFEEHGATYGFQKIGAHLVLLTQNYAALIKLFFDTLRQPLFSHEDLQKNIEIHINEYQRKKDYPAELALRALNGMIYKNSSYAWTFDDALKKLQGLQLQDLTTLHTAFINPSHCVLSVVGDFDLDEMESMLVSLLASWEDKVAYKASTQTPHDTQPFNQDIPLLRDQTLLFLGRPSELTFLDPDFVAVQLLNIAAFSVVGSRIYKLRERTGFFYSAGGSLALGATRERGTDMLYLMLNPDDLIYAEETIRTLLNEVGTYGISHDELKAAQQLYIKHMIDMLTNYQLVSFFLGRIEVLQLDTSFYATMLTKVQTISLEEINAVARKYFHDTKLSRIRVGRTQGIKAADASLPFTFLQ